MRGRSHVKSAIAMLVAFGFLLAGCASEPEKPAPTPEPAAKAAPPPAPVATPTPAPEPKPVAKPEPPKKPAVISVTSTGLFEFNKAALTADARSKLHQEFVARARTSPRSHSCTSTATPTASARRNTTR